jgi:hypothetical protein
MISRRTILFLALVFCPACNPYENRSGEYYAGPVDPELFDPPYVGDLPPGGTPDQSGGTITAKGGYVPSPISANPRVGVPISYYSFPFPDPPPPSSDPTAPPFAPLQVDTFSGGNPPKKAYVFDPQPPKSPFPDHQLCTPPSHYVFDQRLEAYRRDEQGNIFTLLPESGSGYAPVVAEVPVTIKSLNCQDLKSEASAIQPRSDVSVPIARTGGSTIAIPDNNYLAWAIVDPGADVVPIGANGLGPQRWGWFDHYLLAYLDGGYLPTKAVPEKNGVHMHVEFVVQNLYFPTKRPLALPSGVVLAAGHLGDGWDLLDARRGDANYSPICHVFSYEPTNPLLWVDPDLSKRRLPSIDQFDAAEVASASRPDADQGYIFCLQVTQ